jgi:hypothetical protein
VPETVESALVEEFRGLKSAWSNAQEIKGSALSDEQMSSVLTLLGRHDVVVVATAFDVGYQPIEQLEAFRQGQAQAFVNGLTPQHSQHAHRWAQELRRGWLELPLQLMAWGRVEGFDYSGLNRFFDPISGLSDAASSKASAS